MENVSNDFSCTNVFKSGDNKPDKDAVTLKWIELICRIEKLNQNK